MKYLIMEKVICIEKPQEKNEVLLLIMTDYSPQPPFEPEDDLETGEAARGVVGGAVGGEVLDELQLGQLYTLVHHQRGVDLWEPLEHQVLGGVRHWNIRGVKEVCTVIVS